jgi:predicted nuclease of predicted toxin-antitoxin system
VRFLADTNIVAEAVRALRSDGHDVIHAAEREVDPGDEALLAEAMTGGRILLTKDHDFGALVHRDRHQHAGVLVLDDLGNADAETAMILATLTNHGDRLELGAFMRVSVDGVREARN